MILFNTTFGSKGTKLSWERPVTATEAKTKAQKLQKEGFGDEYLYERILTESRVPESVVITPIIENASWNEQAEKEALAPYQKRIADFKKAYAEQKETQRQAILTAKNRDIRAKATKLKDIRKKQATKTIQTFYRDRLQDKQNELADKNFKKMTNILKEFAHNNYYEFKRLVCTKEYLTKTDWLYQFIAIRETKNKDTIAKNIAQNPYELDEYLVKYIDEFNAVIYKTFIDVATEQIEQNNISWIDAVSIPAPENTYGFFTGSPLYPIAFYCCNTCKKIKLTLAEILIALPIEKTLSTGLTDLDINTRIIAAEYGHGLDDYEELLAVITLPDQSYIETYAKDMNNLSDQITAGVANLFENYLYNLSLELNPEEEVLASLIANTYFTPESGPIKDVEKFYAENIAFEQSHINWRKAADQIFWLGCLLIDKNLDAYDALGSDDWLMKQPLWIQNILSKFIKTLPNKTSQPKKYFKPKIKSAKPITATPGSSLSSKKTVPKYSADATETILYLPDEQITKQKQLANLQQSWKKEKPNLLRDLSSL